METVLLLASQVFMVLNHQARELCQVQVLSLLCLLCATIQFSNITLKFRLKRYARSDANITVFYGCCLFSTILFIDEFPPSAMELTLLISILTLFVILVLCKMKLISKILSFAMLFGTILMYVSECNVKSIEEKYFNFISLFNIVHIILFCCVFFVQFLGCRNSFSIGEGVLIAQMMTVLFSLNNVSGTNHKIHYLLEIALMLGKVTMILIYTSMLLFTFCQSAVTRTVIFYSLTMCFIIFACTVYAPWLIKCMVYFAHFVTFNLPQRLRLLACWLVILFACFIWVAIRSNRGKATTAERKSFHAFILVVYVPGVMFDIPLLFICSVFVCAVLAIASTMQAFKIEPLGFCIHRYFERFRSSQDTGKMVLTPLYLLLGLSLPLWLSCAKHPGLLTGTLSIPPIAIYSGIISVGVGDAIASLVGSQYGTLMLPGRKKTVEGTLASILSQLLFVYGLSLSGSIDNRSSNVILAIIVAALTEAYTIEIDNLVVPLLMYFMLDII